MNYKIRESLQDRKIPYVCVVGDRETEENTLAVRVRGIGQAGTFTVDEFIEKMLDEIKSRRSELMIKK